MRCTIPIIEEQANIIYRRTAAPKEQREQGAKLKLDRRRDGSSGSEGDAKPSKGLKRQKPGHFRPRWAEKAGHDTKPRIVTCYRYRAKGHRSFNYLHLQKPGNDLKPDNPGKERGQKA
jgi:hypothetical protein